jgi:hypothetical protein
VHAQVLVFLETVREQRGLPAVIGVLDGASPTEAAIHAVRTSLARTEYPVRARQGTMMVFV